jgi:hypothetical protein
VVLPMLWLVRLPQARSVSQPLQVLGLLPTLRVPPMSQLLGVSQTLEAQPARPEVRVLSAS